MATLDEVTRRHPQTVYAGLQKYLHQECSFVQRVTPYIGMAFQVVEDVLWDIFLPAIFQVATAQIPGRAITGLPVKQAGIALHKPTWDAGENCTASCIITGHLVAALRRTAEFRSGNHALIMWEGREDMQHRHVEEAETDLVEARAASSNPDAQRLGRIQRTGAWLLVLPLNVNGTELGEQEWR